MSLPPSPSIGNEDNPEATASRSAIRRMHQRAKKAQQESEEHFRLLVENVKDYAICMLDPEGHVVSWNAGAQHITGYTADEIIGWHSSCFRTREDVERGTPEQELQSTKKQGRSEVEGWRVRKDGSRFWANVVITALWDEGCQLRGYAKVMRDITERKQAETQLRRSEQELSDFFENAVVALQCVGPDGSILRANQAQLDLLGYSREEYIGHHVTEFHADPPVSADILRRLTDEEALHSYEARLRCKDGSVKHVLISSNVLWKDEKFVHARCFTRDITDRKRLEEELRRQAKELAEADRRKDEFIALVAHELRNPLTPIRNALHVLRQRGKDGATRQWVQDVLGRQVEQMSRLLDDLLDVSRITRGELQLHREQLDLVRLVRVTAEDHSDVLKKAGLTLRLDLPKSPVRVLADATRLTQVLGNLLQNAAKFTDPGGLVTVRLGLDADGERTAVTVQDTGIGIQPELLSAVFEPFVQAERSLERTRGGLGLGLALVKALVELHGGTVRAFSEGPGRGAEITFWLPRDHEAVARPKLSRRLDSPGTHLRVVVVEDNPDTSETLRVLLEMFGHEARVARSGRAGVEAAQQWQPDVVLCDIGLPEMDGYAVARTLRRDPATPKTSLIAISGYGSEADKDRCMEAGFRFHLTKPVDPMELQRVLATIPQVR